MKTRSKHYTLSLPPDLAQWAEDRAAADHRTMSNFIAVLLHKARASEVDERLPQFRFQPLRPKPLTKTEP